MQSRFVHICLILSYIPPLLSASLTNVTVDDANPDPNTGNQFVYSSIGWNFGPECTGCHAQLDRNQTYMGTWHDATYNPILPVLHPNQSVIQTATLQFDGE